MSDMMNFCCTFYSRQQTKKKGEITKNEMPCSSYEDDFCFTHFFRKLYGAYANCLNPCAKIHSNIAKCMMWIECIIIIYLFKWLIMMQGEDEWKHIFRYISLVFIVASKSTRKIPTSISQMNLCVVWTPSLFPDASNNIHKYMRKQNVDVYSRNDKN